MPRSSAPLLLPLLLWMASCSPSEEAVDEPVATGPGGPASADSAALVHADAVVAALGGWEAWNRARYLSFDFVVERNGEELRRTTHHWDRYDGRVRVQGTDRDGHVFDVDLWTETGEGTVRLDGETVEGESRSEWLERARAIWVNDTYWLVMPFKLHDPGVHLTYEGEIETAGGMHSLVLRLGFEPGTGLTSGDQYWVHLDPVTHRVQGWEYHLEGMEPDAERRRMVWEAWGEYGPIELSAVKRSPDGTAAIRFDDLRVAEAVPADAF